MKTKNEKKTTAGICGVCGRDLDAPLEFSNCCGSPKGWIPMSETTAGAEWITLKLSNCLTNDLCVNCGGRCDPGGFDYYSRGTEALVCENCAKAHAPELVKIREAALSYAEREAAAMAGLIGDRVRRAFKEPLEARIMRVIDESRSDNVPF
jgi:hypothetical protein